MPRIYEMKSTRGRAATGALPKKLEETLANPTQTVGERHAEMLRVVLQCVGDKVPDGEIFDRMRRNYPERLTEKEIRDAIAGAHARNPGPTRGHNTGGAPSIAGIRSNTTVTEAAVNHRKVAVDAIPQEALPEPLLTGAAASVQFLRAVFRSEETVCITNGSDEIDGKFIINSKGCFKPLEWWLGPEFFGNAEKHARKGNHLSGDAGAWVRINPCSDESGADSGVSDYRHVLVEFDNGAELAAQWSAIKHCGLPLAAVLTSGGKSLHAWVRVDAANIDEYKARRDVVYSYLADCKPDPANKNPSRWSRLPGVKRAGKEQELLALGIGAASWEEWEREIQDHEMPEEVTVSELRGFDRKKDPNSVVGDRWLCRGAGFIIQGPAGIGKSSFLMQMAISWGLGLDFFGIAPSLNIDTGDIKKLKPLVLQAENDKGDMAEMYQDVCEGMGIKGDTEKELDSRMKFFREQIRTGAEFMRIAERCIRKTGADIVFADPLLAFVGDDISKQDVASRFLRNWLNPILADTGVVWVWLHHVGKPRLAQGHGGTPTAKDLSYTGFGSSELVNWAREVATLSAEEKGFTFSLSKRWRRAAMLDENDEKAESIHLQHAHNLIHWERYKMPYSVAPKTSEVAEAMGADLVSDDPKTTMKSKLKKTAITGKRK